MMRNRWRYHLYTVQPLDLHLGFDTLMTRHTTKACQKGPLNAKMAEQLLGVVA